MNTLKCPQCNLTNWATSISCKRCGQIFQAVENVAPPVQSNQVNPPQPLNSAQTSHNFAPQLYNEAQPFQQNYQPNYQPYPPRGSQKQGMAIASLVLGIVGCFLTSPIGLILGIVSLKKANKNPFEYAGKGLAIAGIILNVLQLLALPVIAAIAIPNLLAARRSANEGSAISSLRTIHSAQMTYQATSGAGNYGEISQLSQAKLIDPALGTGQKSGYRFVITTRPASTFAPATFEITAVPIVSKGTSATGIRSFYIDTEGVIRAANKFGMAADNSDPPIIQ
jgi:type IV pilus assembly protein PilA